MGAEINSVPQPETINKLFYCLWLSMNIHNLFGDYIMIDIQINNWYGDGGQDDYLEITKDILQAVTNIPQKIIITDNNNGVNPRKTTKDTFTIYICSSPKEQDRTLFSPMYMFNKPVDKRNSAYRYAGEGLPVSDGENIVAELFPESLYILHDINYHGTDRELFIYQNILQEVAKYFKSLNAPESVLEINIDEQLEKIDSYFNNQLPKLETDEDIIKQLKQRNKDMVYKRDKALLDLVDLKHNLDGLKEKFEQEYKNIKLHPKVKHIIMIDKHIIIHTNKIYCHEHIKNKWYEIGAFEICISLTENKVYYKNKTQLINGCASHMNAPHIFASGEPCFGTAFKTIIESLINQNEILLLVYEVLRFPEYVNIKDEAGEYITNWPRIDTDSLPSEDQAKVKQLATSSA